jgi:serine/threonine-protein kinase
VGARSEIPPDTLLGGKIRLIKRIGRGGMGDVWIARNEATQAELAVKTLLRAERTPLHDERFRREARLSATISHRNVVRVFDLVDEADGTLGLVMELLRGATLEDAIKERGMLSARQVVAVAIPVLSAMHHVHQRGIVHRDVKPANVFFAVEPDGHVIPKLLDFGIAKLPAAGSALTIDGSVLGTPHYMSPEQIRGQDDLDGRSDMFSFAVVLYEMLTGVRIFHRETASASLAAVLEHEVDPDPRIEPRLWLAITRALAKRPYERYASCAEFHAALRAAIDATDEELANALQELRPRTDALPSTSTVPSIALSTVAPRIPTRSVGTVLGAVVGIAAAVVIAVAVLSRGGSKSSTAEEQRPPAFGATPSATAPEGRAIPPPPATVAAPATTAEAQPKPDPTDAPLVHPAAAGTPPSGHRSSAGGQGERRPRGRPSGVATTPGF